MTTIENRHKVLIIGGGFGGLYAAKNMKDNRLDVTLIDRNNHHLFQPLLYQVATGGLSPADISSPLRGILSRRKNVKVLLGEVTDIDPSSKIIMLGDETIPYDSLIVATGTRNSYFGHENWSQFAPGLKSIEDAIEMRRRILIAFEAAEREIDPTLISEWLTFVIVGGGPTGVELAGAISEIAFRILKNDFRNIDPMNSRIILIESSSRILEQMPESLSIKAVKYLKNLGVEVKLNSRVVNIGEAAVSLSTQDGPQEIATRTCLWAAGVATTSFSEILKNKCNTRLNQSGLVLVDQNMNLPGQTEIFVIGDLAYFDHNLASPLPALAPVAMQQGRFLAKYISAQLDGKRLRPFRYKDKGNLATIGRHAAVGEIGKIKISGLFAWLTWLFIHLMYLAEFDNRLMVLFQWAWNYITFNRGARLITGDRKKRTN